MLIVVDDREMVIEAYTNWFKREGVYVSGFSVDSFFEWFANVSPQDVRAVEGILIGQGDDVQKLPVRIRKVCDAAVIALVEYSSLDNTLELFQMGFDDVVRKPVHAREILARIGAVHRRTQAANDKNEGVVGPIRVFSDGRDPQLNGHDFPLPRRERRILEYLVSNRGRRVNKSQIFNAIYGFFDCDVEENTIESHISKLRKKLRQELDFDPIDSKRFLGYTICV
ncbi:response regulator transcription factor [Brucella intermedia]|uniref:response regulator transcription factor n=1 Tax=Brucella TaxID=234 RepID=UPI0009466980|nr:response regulator transcription factor [Brucella intermedia]